jgi:Hypothetical glycosyl hydrolase 6
MGSGITRKGFLKGASAGAVVLATSGASAQTKAAKTTPLKRPRNRQVHLDFHTSELIEGIGAKFDKAQFQAALKIGRVNHINVFAKCHMGWFYYPSKVGNVHPNLKFDLLGAQLAACKEIGVFAPVYMTVGWSANDAETKPEWTARKKDGSVWVSNGGGVWTGKGPKPGGHWKNMCVASSGRYHKQVLAQVKELIMLYDVDGVWMDIYHLANEGCYCEPCRARMKKEGVNIDDEMAVKTSTARAIKDHAQQVRELLRQIRPKATAYFNASSRVNDRSMFAERIFDLNTQQEIEDLPTAWGGYDNLPLEAKFHLQEGSHVIAMSGKFHKAWGEFGGFKSPKALRYEAAAMIAFGVGCNFGDQLHPNGLMDPATYKNIGFGYDYVEKIEDYGPGGLPYARLGIWMVYTENHDRGISNMLLETHNDYVIASAKNLDQLTTVIIPSKACLSVSEAAQINAWVKGGGKLIVLGAGAMDKAKTRFILDVGAEYIGPASYDRDYTLVTNAIGEDMVASPFLNYRPAMRTKLTSGEALAHVREPFFSRTYDSYMGHGNAPHRPENAHPAVIRNGNVIFFAHPLDLDYLAHGMKLQRDLFRNAITLLNDTPAMKVEGLPSGARVNLLHQKDKNRYVAHLLYAPVINRGDVQVLEDFPEIRNARLTMNLRETVRSAVTVPGNQTLEVQRSGSSVSVTVPDFNMHTVIIFNV